ncbi:MAG: type VI secretion system tip protein VgrG [Bacteroidia bacterium]|nr:type VI secretion system tip protein VgrG [Bacteroidia bacterium]
MSTSPLVQGSQPADAPSFKIYANGTAIPESYLLAGLTVEREVNRITTAELIVYDGDAAAGDFPASNASQFAPGAEISIELGYHQDNEMVFRGVVIRQKIQIKADGTYLRVECKDKAYQLTLGRNNRYFYDKRDSAIISEIVRESSLSGSTDNTAVTHKEMIQYNCSDWDFILSRADVNGMLVHTENGNLKVKKPDFTQRVNTSLTFGQDILELEAEMDGRYQYRDVKAHAWDAANQAMVVNQANNPSASSPGNLSSNSLADETGLRDLNLYHAGQLTGEELQAWASAERQRSQLAKIRGRVRIQGFSKVMPGELIDLQHLGDRFSGQAFVTGVRHELNSSNWETDVAFGLSPECFARQYEDIPHLPAEGLVPAMSGLHIAIVTKLEQDPEGEHRIKVRIPVIDMQGEGSWARVANLDAGNDRGFFFRPEINDEVIVGFLNDDPRNPIVLGQLHSSAKPAPFVAQDTNHEKGYVSRSKMKMVFHDEKKSFTLEMPSGKTFFMDDEAGEIKIEDEHGNKILLNSSGITIDSASQLMLKAAQDATLEGGVNVNIKATSQLTAQGQAGAELSASGNTVVKGAMVQIN